MQSQYENQAVETIGSKQYTPESFEQGYLGDLEYEGSSYLTRLQRASDSGNYPAFMQAQASLSASLEKIIHDLSNRRVNPQKSFGPYASDEEIQRVMALAYTAITKLQTEAAKISAPEDTRSKVPQPIQDLVEEINRRFLHLKAVHQRDNGGGGPKAVLLHYALYSPRCISGDKKLEAQITNSLAPYNI